MRRGGARRSKVRGRENEKKKQKKKKEKGAKSDNQWGKRKGKRRSVDKAETRQSDVSVRERIRTHLSVCASLFLSPRASRCTCVYVRTRARRRLLAKVKT